MVLLQEVLLVFIAGLITALATGLGAVPFFFVDEFGDKWNIVLWGIASGIMVSASLFGLLNEGLQYASTGIPVLLLGGVLTGVVLVEVSDWVLDRVDVDSFSNTEFDDMDEYSDEDTLEAKAVVSGNMKTLVLILGILTVHSFPEGVAIGVSFAELGFDGGISLFGFMIPILAVFMTIAISIHNIPEGTAIAIPMRALGLSKWRMVGAAVFSSLPQPIGAVIAFIFVTWAQEFLPFGFGFAAGAMIYLVITEFIPEALETASTLPTNGYRELTGGIGLGTLLMIPLLYI